MGKYRKRPVEIEAIQYDGYQTTMNRIITDLRVEQHRFEKHGNDFHDVLCRFWIVTPEGETRVDTDDWVIRDGRECYPCKPDIFEATYEPAE